MRKIYSHRIVISFVICLAMNIVFSGSSSAYINTLGKDGEIARDVAARYWSTKHSKRYKQSNCSPHRLHIYYCADPRSPRLARASIGGGMPDYSGSTGRCNLGINKAKIAGKQKAVFCAAIVHEYGHLLGYGHSEKKNSIMYYAFQYSHVDKSGCGKKYTSRDVYK